ncbi:hypothetical protein ALP75_205462 [Pseudomonas syringae pv. actinidiae]|nr:hypothetical protein ALP75_205462 [Pseudomonas syringae pv. actinidiae]GAO91131.1 hypothetical protein PSA5_00460 [Pseudomonas syringae pv. actinidiae]
MLQLGLQRHQLLAQRRLRDVQHIGGLSQAADIDYFHKVFQAAKIQVLHSRVKTAMPEQDAGQLAKKVLPDSS